MRKNISMTIALLCMVVQTAWAQFSGGSGTQADPYQISSVADWNTLATNVEAGDSYSGMYFTLTEDIDNIETMVGSEGKPFSGHFYGNGKELKVSLVPNPAGTAYSWEASAGRPRGQHCSRQT